MLNCTCFTSERNTHTYTSPVLFVPLTQLCIKQGHSSKTKSTRQLSQTRVVENRSVMRHTCKRFFSFSTACPLCCVCFFHFETKPKMSVFTLFVTYYLIISTSLVSSPHFISIAASTTPLLFDTKLARGSTQNKQSNVSKLWHRAAVFTLFRESVYEWITYSCLCILGCDGRKYLNIEKITHFEKNYIIPVKHDS